MKCSCCGEDHIICPGDLGRPSALFAPCPHCNPHIRVKESPVSPDEIVNGPCQCNRRFIDDVMASLYQVLQTEGVIKGTEPLSALGTPLICPGLFLRRPPVLPSRSLILISDLISESAAEIAYRKVPELLGVVYHSHEFPGPGDVRCGCEPSIHEGRLLFGCDVRADIFLCGKGPVIIIKKQADLHIEFPKGIDPKVMGVEEQVRRFHPDVFIDACAGPGTLGITAALFGVPEIIMCDVWHASVWSAIQSIRVNKIKLGISQISIFKDISKCPPVWGGKPVLICEATGEKIHIRLYNGSYEFLGSDLPSGKRLTVFDPFDKDTFRKNDQFLSYWNETIGGEVFIP
ncbi:hypothetical protein ACKUB1_04750 [Methanospirillum stamsii]|uniref:Methyltransferase n=1 Tax=Methanospirillum stamsii TaxID=1277351 RepID=A0A2V2N723_9EURY|nr:hypothetical protein [Methanospirillum stamsii]PWR73526.1 hypothetical protein DLD82_09820 [Methanospirillum stamsii]